MYLLSIHIHEYLRILLTKRRIFAINIRTNANISFEVLVNIHIREYIFVVVSSCNSKGKPGKDCQALLRREQEGTTWIGKKQERLPPVIPLQHLLVPGRGNNYISAPAGWNEYGGPDALLFPPRKHLTPPRKFAFFGVPARDFSSLIPSICFARTACSAPREFGNRARDFESPRARANSKFPILPAKIGNHIMLFRTQCYTGDTVQVYKKVLEGSGSELEGNAPAETAPDQSWEGQDGHAEASAWPELIAVAGTPSHWTGSFGRVPQAVYSRMKVGTSNLRPRGLSKSRARLPNSRGAYGGPDALLFPPRKHLIPPRKFAFFGVPAREFGSLIPSTCFARTACSAPREFGNRAHDFESPRAPKFEVPHFAGKNWWWIGKPCRAGEADRP
ncbi:hypothetical protein B0H11DRAFT_1911848 [Mycena galericulata]|nr:hypothetical protein B0H11DRAFT_1911848 [Mycena galericulata]